MKNCKDSMKDCDLACYAKPVKNYLTQNSKIKKMTGVKTYNWGIPAFYSKTGLKTCPMAGICAIGCYAKQGAYAWSNVQQAYENRLALSQTPEFVSVIVAEIKRRKIKRVRVHDSGDFYSRIYLNQWIEIARECHDVEFYGYTKMVTLFQEYDAQAMIPYNFNFVFSMGGKQDHAINIGKDRHSKVFKSLYALRKAKYHNGTDNDAIAANINKTRIGLVYHGAKSKDFSNRNMVQA